MKTSEEKLRVLDDLRSAQASNGFLGKTMERFDQEEKTDQIVVSIFSRKWAIAAVVSSIIAMNVFAIQITMQHTDNSNEIANNLSIDEMGFELTSDQYSYLVQGSHEE